MTNMKPTSIEDAFNLVPIQPNNFTLEQITASVEDDTAISDFKQARANIKNIIEIGTEAIKGVGELARASQDPSHYEVLSKMMKDLSDISEKLLKTHESLERITNKKNNKKVGETNSGMFLSTSDLSKVVLQIESKKEVK